MLAKLIGDKTEYLRVTELKKSQHPGQTELEVLDEQWQRAIHAGDRLAWVAVGLMVVAWVAWWLT